MDKALAFIYDYVKQYLTKGQIEDEELEKLVANGNFGKLYGYALKKFDGIKKDNEQINLLYNKDILENAIVQLLDEN